MITVSNLTFSYPGNPPVLNGIFISIPSGSYTALMGSNGAGKTTLALLLKGLLMPSSGTVNIDGLTTDSETSRFEIMKCVGLVFQNPDNTIVTTTVERELAFGLENMSVPNHEMKDRVDEALDHFALEKYRHTNPLHLSGGEKQRLALAAVMIMRPDYLVLDEPTSLLDPWGRDHILRLIHNTAREGTTVIHITQFLSEALTADRVIVLDKSGVFLDGSPGDVLPGKNGFRTGCIAYPSSGDRKDIRESARIAEKKADRGSVLSDKQGCTPVISLDTVTHWYDKGMPFGNRALSEITLELFSGSSTVVLGTSGSGKTTLLEIAAGVTVPTHGRVRVKGEIVCAMAFQFPEDQMFGDTVESYVAFGPQNMNIPESELEKAVTESLRDVGLAPELFRNRDPLTLSGGEKRRAAIAGVLSMKPDALILDEPTAGLDWDGMELIAEVLRKYIDNGGTLLFSTHDFEVAGKLAERALVLEKGSIECWGTFHDVIHRSKRISLLKKSPYE